MATTTELSDVIGDWVKSRRAAGVAPHDVLEALGLQVSQEAAVDESALWAMVALLVEEHRQRAQPRRRLATADGLTAVVDLVRRSERIMVVAGAGASASAGLPDFRVAAAAAAHSESPDALFDVHHFVNDPKPLYALAAEMWTGKALPTPTHMFVRELERRGQLLRLYSENIDALELAAGIERRVLCHGWCASASCIACKAAVGAEALRAALAAGEESWPLRCAKCTHGLNLVKPDVACFGEPPPPEVERSLREDLKSADLLLFIGSDARVHPLAAVAPALPRDVPQLLVGRAPPPREPHEADALLLGECDEVVKWLSAELGWTLPPPPPAAAAAADAEHADGGAAAADPAGPAPAKVAAPAFHEPNKFVFASGSAEPPTESPRAQTPLAVPGPRHRAHGGRAAPRE